MSTKKRTLIDNILLYIIPIVLSLALLGDVGYTYLAVTGPTVYNIKSTGVITQGSALFKVAFDPTGVNIADSFNWGNLSPGETTSVTLYLINTGTTPATFTYNTDTWNPSNSEQYLQFTYTASTTPLQPGQFRKVVFTLYVLPTITVITNFSFNVVVTGTA